MAISFKLSEDYRFKLLSIHDGFNETALASSTKEKSG
jgi:hypothetical protein